MLGPTSPRTSKHWQANFDYVLARMQQRIAYQYEYTSQLGNMRTALPDLDKTAFDGWCLVSVGKLQGDKIGKDANNAAKKLLTKMAEDYKGTPWEILAKRDWANSLGLDVAQTKVRNR